MAIVISSFALVISLVSLYLASYWKSTKVFGKLVEINNKFSEIVGEQDVNICVFRFILSSLGNQSVFIDSIFITEGVHKSYTEHGKRYRIKQLIKNGSTEEIKIDLVDFNFEKNKQYTVLITVYNPELLRFDMSDNFMVIETDPFRYNFKINRFCQFKANYHNFSLIKQMKIWFVKLKRNKNSGL